ncbi:MAG TPA: (2Fe-2S)-binding protein [Gaiellaceae bacterium]|nr:(2Fe-2S)-binding protein [Gaiellaceae bacterium]
MRLELTANGDPYRREIEPDATLLDVLRDVIGLTGTKWGCKTGDCGACTVLVDGQPVVSCLQLACQVDGRAVTTVEGLGPDGDLGDLQAAFVRYGGAQCGFCTPGMLVSAEALLRHNPAPTEAEVREALAGNLCRCTGYNKIVDAVLETAQSRATA